jgi:hypothetical protein
MVEVFDHDDPNASKLTDEDRAHLRKMLKKVQALLPEIKQPMDPKIYPLVEVVESMIQTQLDLELHFTYADCETEATDEEVKEAVQQVKKELKDKKKSKKKETKPAKTTSPEQDFTDWFDSEE